MDVSLFQLVSLILLLPFHINCHSFVITLLLVTQHRSSHHGRSSPGGGLSIHRHPWWNRPTAVPWGSTSDLPLWPPLLEEKVHSLQGETCWMCDGSKVQRVSVKNEGSFVNSMSNTFIWLFGLENEWMNVIVILASYCNLQLLSFNLWCW